MKQLARHLVRAGVASANRGTEQNKPAPSLPPEVAAPLDSWEDQMLEEEQKARKKRKIRAKHEEYIGFVCSKDDRRTLEKYAKRHRFVSLSECIRTLLMEGVQSAPVAARPPENEKTPPRGGASRR